MNKLHSVSGFTAFWIYVTVKNIHFGSQKYDITKRRLPRKAQFLKSWNNGRKDRDGIMFMRIMEKMPSDKESYIRLFASYYMKNPSFHVSEILNDGFQTYHQNELELKDILNTVKSDYLTSILYCTDKDIKPQKMFYGDNKIPLIFKLYDRGLISINSLIAFNIIFGIRYHLTDRPINIVDENKVKKYLQIFDKYSPIVYDFFKLIEWKNEVQAFHHEINS